MRKIIFNDYKEPGMGSDNLNLLQIYIDEDKQNTLIAGTGISIDENDVISVAGGGASLSPVMDGNSGNLTIGSLNVNTIDITINKTGYTPIGLGGMISNKKEIIVSGGYIVSLQDGSCTVRVQGKNMEASQQTATITAYAVWIQNQQSPASL